MLVSPHRLAVHRKLATISDIENLSLQDIVTKVRAANYQLKAHQLNHKQLRSDHLEALADAIVLDSNAHNSISHVNQESVKKKIKKLIRRENMRKTYRKIGYLLSPQTTKGLTMIDIPDHRTPSTHPPDPKTWTGPWKTTTNPLEIASIVKEINRKQYHQVHDTPFGSGPIAEVVGREGDTPKAALLISGTVPTLPSETLPEVHHVLQTLARPYPSTQHTANISDEEFSASYRVAKEATSSSPSGRHVGHYKAILKYPDLVNLHASMMSLAFKTGVVPDRWNKVVDIMLEKTPGDSRCHWLRIIALFESDLNHAKRILIGRKLSHFLEDQQMLPDMQFGSLSGQRCPSAVLKKVLSHDHVRILKQTAAYIENDAIGCYDRLMNNLILMVLNELGLPSSISLTLSKLWDSTIHFIKTIYGTSTGYLWTHTKQTIIWPGARQYVRPIILASVLLVNSRIC
jgi:hypothetical protein